MACKVNVRKYWVYKVFYSVLAVLACLVIILLAVDPLTSSLSIGTLADGAGGTYEIDQELGDVSIAGALGLMTSVRGQLFSARKSRTYQEGWNDTLSNCLYFGSQDQIRSKKDIDPRVTIFKEGDDRAIYKAGGKDIVCVDYDSYQQNFSQQNQLSYVLLAIGCCVLLALLLFVWLTCEGWCRCNSPCKAAASLTGDFI